MHTENCDFPYQVNTLPISTYSLKSVCGFFTEHTAKEKGAHVSIPSSWPLFCSIFISTRSIISHMWDEGTAQEPSNCISWNFISEILLFYLGWFTHINHLQPAFSNNEHPEIQLLPVGVAGIQNIWWSSTFVSAFPTVKWRQQLLQRVAMRVVIWEL